MNGLGLVVLGAFERGIIFALLVLGVYTTSRIMKFDDLSLEGSFSFGAALGAIVLGWGVNPFAALIFALCGGMIVGGITSAIHCGLGLSMLISGIVVTSGLFSVVLMMAGSTISLIGTQTCFSQMTFLGDAKNLSVILLCALILYGFLYHLLHRSSVGIMLRATGANVQLVSSLGRRVWVYKACALIVANGLTAFGGALYVQYVGYFSIWMNVGILVVSLTGLMIAELFPIRFALIHLLIGSVVYQLLLSLVYECDIDPQWSKLLTAVLVLAVATIKIINSRGAQADEGSR
ncbi:hypothetical protein FJ366_03275 [Candidatus Dependentiae bacterium]|nr:hypothetical protein [Candidatus Dependentiae bacterium]